MQIFALIDTAYQNMILFPEKEEMAMKKPQLKFWYPIIGLIIIGAIDTINWGLKLPVSATFLIADLVDWASGVCLIILLYIIIRNIVRAIKSLIARRSGGRLTWCGNRMTSCCTLSRTSTGRRTARGGYLKFLR